MAKRQYKPRKLAPIHPSYILRMSRFKVLHLIRTQSFFDDTPKWVCTERMLSPTEQGRLAMAMLMEPGDIAEGVGMKMSPTSIYVYRDEFAGGDSE